MFLGYLVAPHPTPGESPSLAVTVSVGEKTNFHCQLWAQDPRRRTRTTFVNTGSQVLGGMKRGPSTGLTRGTSKLAKQFPVSLLSIMLWQEEKARQSGVYWLSMARRWLREVESSS